MGMARDLALRAKQAAARLAQCDDATLSSALRAMADALMAGQAGMLSANARDIEAARQKGLSEAMIERLTLTPKRIEGMASGLREVSALPSPLGAIEYQSTRPNGLRIESRRVPFGVIGVIYESRPNVTADAAGLCIKSGNAVLLRGGSEALQSNLAVAGALLDGARKAGLPEDAVVMMADPDRAHVEEMLRLDGIIDLLVPRGGAGLIQNVADNATVPVLRTGTGMCHVYVHAQADVRMAIDIIVNAKANRPSTCNAAETLLIDEAIAAAFLPPCVEALQAAGVELRGDQAACALSSAMLPAREGEWDDEHLALVLGVKIVPDMQAALAHIDAHGTRHSEAIVTRDDAAAAAFMAAVDAAAVYRNASTRFTDGGEFGLGAEIGISNQKLHARGPVGIAQLTTIKYYCFGEGQLRA